MTLKPRVVDFDEIWARIKETLYGVVTLAPIPKLVWNDRFSYPFLEKSVFPYP